MNIARLLRRPRPAAWASAPMRELRLSNKEQRELIPLIESALTSEAENALKGSPVSYCWNHWGSVHELDIATGAGHVVIEYVSGATSGPNPLPGSVKVEAQVEGHPSKARGVIDEWAIALALGA